VGGWCCRPVTVAPGDGSDGLHIGGSAGLSDVDSTEDFRAVVTRQRPTHGAPSGRRHPTSGPGQGETVRRIPKKIWRKNM
jgi:hypothetical protein